MTHIRPSWLDVHRTHVFAPSPKDSKRVLSTHKKTLQLLLLHPVRTSPAFDELAQSGREAEISSNNNLIMSKLPVVFAFLLTSARVEQCVLQKLVVPQEPSKSRWLKSRLTVMPGGCSSSVASRNIFIAAQLESGGSWRAWAKLKKFLRREARASLSQVVFFFFSHWPSSREWWRGLGCRAWTCRAQDLWFSDLDCKWR